MLHAVVMAGGSGTRFWPLSRRSYPKQFLRLGSERSLLQETFERCRTWIPTERFWIVTAERLLPPTREHLPEVSRERILLEPCARNTAPCIALAALCMEDVDPQATMAVLPADHLIAPPEAFQQDLLRAATLVESDPERLVLLGAPPRHPATGFGYIERGDAIPGGAFEVRSFREKPDRMAAEGYLRRGDFFWNCGIFVWKAARILSAVQRHEPLIHDLLEELRPHLGRPSWNAALADAFPRMPAISIDYAVLERERQLMVVESTFDWDDVGSWEAMAARQVADSDGNVVSGNCAAVDSRDCIVHGSPDHLIALLGMEGCLVVQTPTATLVARRGDDERLRRLTALLEQRGDERFL